MNLFETFLAEMGIYAIIPDDQDIKFTTDHSDFVVVDGEEGDHGIIRYCDGNGIVAIHTVDGGASDHIQFTPHGVGVMIPLAEKWLNDRFTEHLQQYYKTP